MRQNVKAGRTKRKLRPGKRRGDDDGEELESKSGIGLHWYIFSLSILLVTGLSFLNFLALPDARAHSLLSAVLIRKKAAISGDPHSDPGLGGISDEERLALLKAAEEALQAPMPIVPQSPPVLPAAPLPTSRVESAAPDAKSGSSGRSVLNSLRGRSQAAASGHPAFSLKDASLHGGAMVFSGDAWLWLVDRGDADELTFGAWIFLPKVPDTLFPFSSESMKTIAATKASGCSPSSRGWAFFVHEWSTTNRQLRLSWSDDNSGCHEIYSESVLVPYDRWVLVGFSMSKSENRASIVVDKHLAVDTTLGLGKYSRQGTTLDVSQASVMRRSLAMEQGLHLGAHQPSHGNDFTQSHIFIGYIGDVRLLTYSPDPIALEPLLAAPADDLLQGKRGVPQSAVAVLMQPRYGLQPVNLRSGVELELRHATGGASSASLGVVQASATPTHPLLVNSPAGSESQPGTTLDPAELRRTWPADWLTRFSADELLRSQREADVWADEVRDAMRHTWKGYRARAWGHDDIQPVRGAPKDWCRMAITMLDGLSTLWMMGLKDEFNDAAKWMENNPLPAQGSHGLHSLFEINIRAFGGLLSAYSLSSQSVFLQTAKRLGNNLLGAFGTPNGIPKSTVDVGTGAAGKHSWNANVVLAEATTLQVEFRYISHVTGDNRWKDAADKAMNTVLKAANGRGLVPIYIRSDSSSQTGFSGGKISMGAMGDSYYEYLLKQWIQSGKKEDHLKNAWKKAMQEMMDRMVVTTAGGLKFVAELDGGRTRNRMDHLACFVAGMLMLGSRTLPKHEVDPRWEPFAAELTRTCYEMYARTPTGLSPEYVTFDLGAAQGHDMNIPNDAPHNLLRPEAAEAVYYMWYYTGDPKYRQWGHQMFAPFLKYCKTKFGFSAVSDVRRKPPPMRDSQESFWLAETLKYFYLIFSPRNTLNLKEWVLNTEAQPLRMWSD
eukprot:TRINITY_DN31262_c0_g1_i1.p1 TRINITY_DN31262_c0_g1~~TRINITY_DN31262_c0_g1_i1.p1  ORF type:complete len:945 (-),score=148.70 TRINITY_DN31262_c0_g1_i1:11-2845(-)